MYISVLTVETMERKSCFNLLNFATNFRGKVICATQLPDKQVADYDNNHSLILLLSKSNFFSYDSLDGGSSRVTGPPSL
jgi:hypothetical protein